MKKVTTKKGIIPYIQEHCQPGAIIKVSKLPSEHSPDCVWVDDAFMESLFKDLPLVKPIWPPDWRARIKDSLNRERRPDHKMVRNRPGGNAQCPRYRI